MSFQVRSITDFIQSGQPGAVTTPQDLVTWKVF